MLTNRIKKADFEDTFGQGRAPIQTSEFDSDSDSGSIREESKGYQLSSDQARLSSQVPRLTLEQMKKGEESDPEMEISPRPVVRKDNLMGAGVVIKREDMANLSPNQFDKSGHVSDISRTSNMLHYSESED